MVAPTPYARQFSFTSFSTSNPASQQPGTSLDQEFNAIVTSLNATITDLNLIQRADGALQNQSVSVNTIDATVLALLSSTGVPRGAWLTGTAYAAKDIVTQASASYICVVAHTAGVFATDLAAVKWIAMTSAQSAAQTAFTPDGFIVATNVSAALTELGGDIQANLTTFNTHTANLSAHGISAFGQTVVTAASAAALRTVAGLANSATIATGTSGATIPLLNGANTHSGASTFSALLTASLGATVTGAGIVAGAPTGGDKGAGTANLAGHLYENGARLDWLAQAPVYTSTGAMATGTTLMPGDTVPTSSQGDQYMTLAFTPVSTGSAYVDVSICGGNSNGNHMLAAVYQDSGANAIGSMIWYATAGDISSCAFRVKLTGLIAGVSTTLKVRAGSISGAAPTFTFNGAGGARQGGGSLVSSITITEVLP